MRDVLAPADPGQGLLAPSSSPGGYSTVAGRPTISAAAYPYIPSAAGFQLAITPSRVSPTMASSDELTIAGNSPASARS